MGNTKSMSSMNSSSRETMTTTASRRTKKSMESSAGKKFYLNLSELKSGLAREEKNERMRMMMAIPKWRPGANSLQPSPSSSLSCTDEYTSLNEIVDSMHSFSSSSSPPQAQPHSLLSHSGNVGNYADLDSDELMIASSNSSSSRKTNETPSLPSLDIDSQLYSNVNVIRHRALKTASSQRRRRRSAQKQPAEKDKNSGLVQYLVKFLQMF